MKNRSNWASVVLLTAALVLALVAPALATGTSTPTSVAADPVTYPTPTMARLTQSTLPVAAFSTSTVATAAAATAPAATPAVHRAAAKPAAEKPARTSTTKTTRKVASVHSASPSGTARTAAASAAKASRSSSPAGSKASDLATAQSVLAGLKDTYKYLDGVTVEIGTTPGGYQAVSYFTTGRILISPKHTVSIRTILKHEIWHIIDWRDNGHIDWSENVPPANAASYRL